MRGKVKLFAPIFMSSFDLSRFQRMCDLGGGTGNVAYAACMAYPNMKITVLDLPSVVQNAPHFRPSIHECPNQHNVTFVAGDFFEPTLPAADLYVLTHILHLFTDDKVDTLLANIFANLPSGGGVLIGEVLLYDDKLGPLYSQYMSLVMLLAFDGRERSGLEYKQLLEKHGFKDVQWKYTHTNSLDAVLAIKP
ncbi:acetylserotonin O-methyltransferase-like [Actinia tenebrosa]|uniref:Acetylserotonin O-methyltransferase n=1 Tax=Actinia tenebrosa TaxID=6105 RepID=A0A6P8HDQ5_ACTTE|nr:acetylserotonin O-methyltransferase-like [Actinia tenebrosa]